MSASERASLMWPVASNSTSSPTVSRIRSHNGRARRASGSSARWRPCWRTPPKLTPLAPAPQRPFSSSTTVSPACRSAAAAAQPAMPPPTIATSARRRSVTGRRRGSGSASPGVGRAAGRRSHVGAAGTGKELGGGVAADPPLATAHADAGQRLEAVHLANVLRQRRVPQLSHRNALAAAEHLLVGHILEEVGRIRIGALDRVPKTRLAGKPAIEPRRLGGVDRAAEVLEHRKRRAPALQLRPIGSADAGAVARQINAGHGRAPLWRALRRPLARQRIEGEGAAGKIGELRFAEKAE